MSKLLYHAVFSTLLLLGPSWAQKSSWAPYYGTPSTCALLSALQTKFHTHKTRDKVTVLDDSIPNIMNSSCQQVTMHSVLNNHTVWFTCAPLCLIPALFAVKIRSVNRQYTQPRHQTHSGEGAIVWAPHEGTALVCGLPEEWGQASLIRRPLCHQAQCVWQIAPRCWKRHIKGRFTHSMPCPCRSPAMPRR